MVFGMPNELGAHDITDIGTVDVFWIAHIMFEMNKKFVAHVLRSVLLRVLHYYLIK